MKDNIKTIKIVLGTLAALLLAAVIFVAVLIIQPAFAGQPGVSPAKGITSVLMDEDDDYVYVIDQETKRIGVYWVAKTGEIYPRGMRDYKYDIMLKDTERKFANGATAKDAAKAFEKQVEAEQRAAKNKR